jgi:hypothetical protein
MAPEWNASMTCSPFSRPFARLVSIARLTQTVEGRLEPQAHCHRPAARRRSATQSHSERSEVLTLVVGVRGQGVRPSAIRPWASASLPLHS